MPRIIAGEFRSRRLLSPDDSAGTRPYLDHVKEAVFNLLRGWFDGARVLDLFAGIGSMGLEAVSRGASEVVMVEKNLGTYRLLQENIAALGCDDRATAVMADALSTTCLSRAPNPADIVFIDPPFEMIEDSHTRQRVLNQMARCRGIMGDSGFIVLRVPHTQEEIDWSVPGLQGPEVHTYGKSSRVLLYAPAVGEQSPPTDLGHEQP